MKYITSYSQYMITESRQIDASEVLCTIKNASGGCSLKELLETYPDPAQTMTILDTLKNQSSIELVGGKYKVVKE